MLIAAAVIFVTALVIASINDIKTKTIPDFVHLLLILSGLFALIGGKVTPLDGILSFMGFGIVLLIVGVKTNGLGGGDVKLCACAALSLGFERMIFAMFFACLGGCIAFLIKKLLRDKDKTIWYAPFLAGGFLIMYFI